MFAQHIRFKIGARATEKDFALIGSESRGDFVEIGATYAKLRPSIHISLDHVDGTTFKVNFAPNSTAGAEMPSGELL